MSFICTVIGSVTDAEMRITERSCVSHRDIQLRAARADQLVARQAGLWSFAGRDVLFGETGSGLLIEREKRDASSADNHRTAATGRFAGRRSVSTYHMPSTGNNVPNAVTPGQPKRT